MRVIVFYYMNNGSSVEAGDLLLRMIQGEWEVERYQPIIAFD